ncbi:hypothetical protein Q1695_005406 [Nippostrongylus brasiliensis]|nr:hypothetical protein Q1695_005406 [Nippostrongylus brasiliensis]
MAARAERHLWWVGGRVEGGLLLLLLLLLCSAQHHQHLRPVRSAVIVEGPSQPNEPCRRRHPPSDHSAADQTSTAEQSTMIFCLSLLAIITDSHLTRQGDLG